MRGNGYSDKIRDLDSLDDGFWELESMLPKKSKAVFSKDTEAEEIDIPQGSEAPGKKLIIEDKASQSKRSLLLNDILSKINENNAGALHFASDEVNSAKRSPQVREVPSPIKNALVESITVTGSVNSNTQYGEKFRSFAQKHFSDTGAECKFVESRLYYLNYHLFSKSQLDYYFWWRGNFREGKYIETCANYISLFCYELINLTDLIEPSKAVEYFIALWNNYDEQIVQNIPAFPIWLYSYCTVNCCPLPYDVFFGMLTKCAKYNIFFYQLEGNEYDIYLLSLLYSDTEFPWMRALYYNDGDAARYIEYMKKAFLFCAKRLSTKYDIFSDHHPEMKIMKNRLFAFDGVICTDNVPKYIDITYKYYPRTYNGVRLITAVVKICENRLRAYFGVKSKLREDQELKPFIVPIADEFFVQNGLVRKKKTKKAAEEEREKEYLAQYDAVKTDFSFEDAKKIESDSWKVTEVLVNSFDDDDNEDEDTYEEEEDTIYEDEIVPAADAGASEDTSSGDGLIFDACRALLEDRYGDFISLAKDNNLMPQTLADRINGLLLESIGDICLEEHDGKFVFIEDYIEDIEKIINS